MLHISSSHLCNIVFHLIVHKVEHHLTNDEEKQSETHQYQIADSKADDINEEHKAVPHPIDVQHDDTMLISHQVQLSPKTKVPPRTKRDIDSEQKQQRESKRKSRQNKAATKVIKSLTGCMINEINSSRLDYSLLRELNNKSALEYIDMTDRAKLLVQSMEVMNEQESQLMAELTKIDDLVEEVNQLDSVVSKLDEYTKNLHAQFHKLYSTK